VAAGIGLELLSCLGYVVLFELVFDTLRGRLAQLLSLSELAVNSVVSASGLGGLALGVWVLHGQGFSAVTIARRSILIFVLTSAVNVAAVIVIGVPMWLGLLHGSSNPRLTLLPAAAAAVAIAATLGIAAWARRVALRSRLRARAAGLLSALADGIVDALRLTRGHDWRVSGAVAYWLFDNLVLYTALRGFGSAPPVWVVLMAYLVGMLANSLPIPGGFVAVEGGLVGMLLLFKVRPASQVLAAVLIYRAISLWIPALVGSLAFLRLRRELSRPLASGASG
jgi:glycosyltransferase 2 family protein